MKHMRQRCTRAAAILLAVVFCLSCLAACGGENRDRYTRIDENGKEKRTGEYLLFGSYPQSEVTDNALKTTLTTMAGELPTEDDSCEWITYPYFQNGKVESYMWYRDLSYGEARYRGVYFTQYRPFYTQGDAEPSKQLLNGYETGAVYWFRYDPIKWRIVHEEEGVATLVAELLLDAQEFNDHERESGNYAESKIRRWLDSTLAPVAFTHAERAIIQKTMVDNSLATTKWSHCDHLCEDTEDFLYFLSYQEAVAYFDSAEARQKVPTPYAKSQGCITASEGEACAWWLRSPAQEFATRVHFVAHTGDTYDCDVNLLGVGVCPALRIKL